MKRRSAVLISILLVSAMLLTACSSDSDANEEAGANISTGSDADGEVTISEGAEETTAGSEDNETADADGESAETAVTDGNDEAEEGAEEMSTLEFFKSLNYDDGLSVVTDIFEHFPLQYATTLGLDGSPQIRPIEFKFEEDGVLYFDTVTYYTSYKELQAYPYIQLCICDQETMTYVRLSGTVNFTTDEDIIDRCFEASEVLTSQFGENRELVIAYYLTEVTAEFVSFSDELPSHTYTLTNKFDTAEDA